MDDKAIRGVLRASVIVLAVIYLGAANDHWFPTKDSAFYLSIGRSYAEGTGYAYQGRGTRGIEPMVPMLLAANYRLFGDHYLALNILYKLLGLGIIGWTYLLTRQIWRPTEPGPLPGGAVASEEAWWLWALMPAACVLAVGLASRLYHDSTKIMLDVPFTFLMLGGFVAAGRIRRSLWWAAAAWGLLLAATMTRVIGVTFVAAMGLALLLPGAAGPGRPWPWRRRLIAVLPALAVAAAVFCWTRIAASQTATDPGGKAAIFQQILGELWNKRLPEAPGVLAQMPGVMLGAFWAQKSLACGYVAVAVMLVGMVRLVRRRQWLAVTPIWLYLPALSLVGSAMVNTRFMLPVLTFMAIWLLAGAEALAELALGLRARSVGRRRAVLAAAAWLSVAVLVSPALPQIANTLFYCSHHPRYDQIIDGGRWGGYFAAARWLRQNTPADSLVFADQAPVVFYFSRRHTLDPATKAPPPPPRAEDWPKAAAAMGADYVLVVGGEKYFAGAVEALRADPRFIEVQRSVPAGVTDWSKGARKAGRVWVVFHRQPATSRAEPQ